MARVRTKLQGGLFGWCVYIQNVAIADMISKSSIWPILERSRICMTEDQQRIGAMIRIAKNLVENHT